MFWVLIRIKTGETGSSVSGKIWCFLHGKTFKMPPSKSCFHLHLFLVRPKDMNDFWWKLYIESTDIFREGHLEIRALYKHSPHSLTETLVIPLHNSTTRNGREIKIFEFLDCNWLINKNLESWNQTLQQFATELYCFNEPAIPLEWSLKFRSSLFE